MAKTLFRETMWFKLGEQEEPAPVDGDETAPCATVAMLPIEDRYEGADISAQDTAQFGLHTGMTDRMKALNVVAVAEDDASMKTLVREMKSNKRLWMLAASAAAVCSLIAVYVG